MTPATIVHFKQATDKDLFTSTPTEHSLPTFERPPFVPGHGSWGNATPNDFEGGTKGVMITLSMAAQSSIVLLEALQPAAGPGHQPIAQSAVSKTALEAQFHVLSRLWYTGRRCQGSVFCVIAEKKAVGAWDLSRNGLRPSPVGA